MFRAATIQKVAGLLLAYVCCCSAARVSAHSSAKSAGSQGLFSELSQALSAGQLADDIDVDAQNSSWTATVDHPLWASRLVNNMLGLTVSGNPILVDDHQATPIGEGDTLGLVGGVFKMDADALAQLPPNYRVGLLKSCPQGECTSWPAAVRFSHARAVEMDLSRIAVKLQTDEFGEVDLLTTETLPSFPMHDRNSLEAFTYMEESGAGWAMLKYPVTLVGMKRLGDGMKAKYGSEGFQQGPLGKTYYSQLPYALGNGAMKFRLRPAQSTDYPSAARESESLYKEMMRQDIARGVSHSTKSFYFDVQIANDPEKHPLNDAAAEWDTASSPYVNVGMLTIPQQSFEAPIEQLTAANCVGSALWENGAPAFNSKELLFNPGSSPHAPIGDIGEFRAHLYPKYDKERQQHLLGKVGGIPAKCPFSTLKQCIRDGVRGGCP